MPTLHELAGQIICPVLPGRKAVDPEHVLRDLQAHGWGGYIVFRGEADLAPTLTRLQAAAPYPLLVASDIETGAGQQLTGATVLPPLMALGASGSEDDAYEAGLITALEARAQGVNWAFAPVADVNVNPLNPIINIRSFGGDASKVGRLAAAWVRGAQDHGLLATAKHFPGHGDTEVDSHSRLPTLLAERSRLDAVELPPFARCIEAGVGAVMTAHLAVPALDPSGVPATLSRAIMTDLLRGELGFEGLVVTDALIMGGITGDYSEEDAVAAALNAGCDVLLMPRDPVRAKEAVVAAVESGKVPLERLIEAFERMQAARRKLGLFENRMPLGTAGIDRKAHAGFAQRVGERALTLVRGADCLPLGKGTFFVIVNDDHDQALEAYAPGSELDPNSLPWPLTDELDRRDIPWALAWPGMSEPERADLLARARAADSIAIGIFALVKAWKDRSDLSDDMAALVGALASGPQPAIAVSFNSPYLIRQFPQITAYACTYGPFDYLQRAAVRALFGESPFTGRLPVELDAVPVASEKLR